MALTQAIVACCWGVLVGLLCASMGPNLDQPEKEQGLLAEMIRCVYFSAGFVGGVAAALLAMLVASTLV